ncbi:MAG: glycosyltransferase [Candidatus Jordarchaeaceae archaeon]
MVTVGVCVKNCEDTVKDAVRSIISQDFSHELMEVIVVDGCSSDRTVKKIKDVINHSNIKYRIFSEDKGLGYARQIVVDNALGDFIIWVDGDMVLPKNFVTKQISFMKNNPDVGIGRAKYGVLPEQKYVAFLENIPFVVESWRHEGDVPLSICGTEGAIYRVCAIKEVGGFDINMRGAGEDTDLARRILDAGWLAKSTDAIFYEQCKESWMDLWKQYSWWGYGGHYIYHKTKDFGMPFKISPLGGFLAGILRFPFAYKLTARKILFLLPFHYAFKRLAFCYGFTKAHIKGYGHHADVKKTGE